MKRRTAAAIAVIMLVGAGAVAPVAASPDSTTVVVAVGDSSTVMLTANAIADQHGYSVVRAPENGLNTSTVQALKERKEQGELTDAIVVGVRTDAVVNDLNSDVGFDTVHEIEPDSSDTPARVTYIGSLRQWESASTAFVVANDTTDQRKVAVALGNTTGPVLSAELDTEDIEGVLNYLGVTTVYVTPEVSDTKRSVLNESYTVKSSVDGVGLDNTLQTVAGGIADAPEEVVVTTPKHVLETGQFGALTNSSVLVAESSSALGPSARKNLTGVSHAYAVGVDTSVVESETSANVTTVGSYVDLRTSLLAADYSYPIVVSAVNDSGQRLSVSLTNIGFASVPVVDNVTVTAKWKGVIQSSDPAGEKIGDFHVVEFHNPLSSGETVDVSLAPERVENGGHPQLEYYAQVPSGDGLLGLGSNVGGPLLDFAPSVLMVVLAAFLIALIIAGPSAWLINRFLINK